MRQGWLGIALLAGAIVAVSSGSIFARWAMAAAGRSDGQFSLVLAAGRLAIATLFLAPLGWSSLQQHWPSRRQLVLSLAAGTCLALHFALWLASLAYTSITASTALVTTTPLWVALVGWCRGQVPSRLTLGGMGVALGGGAMIAAGSGGGSLIAAHPGLGNACAIAGAWAVTGYLLLGQAVRRAGLPASSYGLMAYGAAALILLPLPLLGSSWGSGYGGISSTAWGAIALSALVPQALGHTGLNWALARVSPLVVALGVLLEPVIASLLGWALFGEVPGTAAASGAALLVLGVALSLAGQR